MISPNALSVTRRDKTRSKKGRISGSPDTTRYALKWSSMVTSLVAFKSGRGLSAMVSRLLLVPITGALMMIRMVARA